MKTLPLCSGFRWASSRKQSKNLPHSYTPTIASAYKERLQLRSNTSRNIERNSAWYEQMEQFALRLLRESPIATNLDDQAASSGSHGTLLNATKRRNAFVLQPRGW